MKIEKNRHMLILYHLTRAEETLTAEVLARLSKSSIRSVKNDIVFLNAELEKEKIARIVSYKAKGYRLEVLDEDNYKDFYTNVFVLHSLFYNRSIESVNRRLYILKRFLVDEYVKIDDLCEKLYLSRSALRNDIAWAIKFLESYHISLKTTANGYHVEGKEQDLRSALVELRCSQYHEFQPLNPYQPFDDLFLVDGVNHYGELRRAFLNVLRSSRIVVSDISAKKIASHICLMKNRTNPVELRDEIIEELRNTYNYEVSKQIFNDKVIREYVQASDLEIINFARLLFINQDFNLRTQGIDDIPIKLIDENLKLFNEIVESMKGSIGGKLLDTDLFRLYSRDLESLQLQLYMRYHFDYTSKIRFITYLEGVEDVFSPIPFELTRAMIARLQKRFDSEIRDIITMSYAGVFERLLKKVTYPYKKMRLAVTSTEGLVYSQHLAEAFHERYEKYIQSIEVYNLYEMRKLNFADYDAIVHSGFVLYYNYPVPLVDFKELDYEGNSDVFESVFKEGYDRSEIEEIKKVMKIHPDTNISSIDNFVEALSYRYADNDVNQKNIYRQYKENDQIIDHYYDRNSIMILFIPYMFCNKKIFDIYIPSQTVYYDDMEVKAFMAVCVDPDNQLPDLKILDHVLRYIVQVDGTVENLMKDKDTTLENIFHSIIKRSFYNL